MSTAATLPLLSNFCHLERERDTHRIIMSHNQYVHNSRSERGLYCTVLFLWSGPTSADKNEKINTQHRSLPSIESNRVLLALKHHYFISLRLKLFLLFEPLSLLQPGHRIPLSAQRGWYISL